jgi:hypothetical protein
LRLVARPAGLLLGALKTAIQVGGVGEPLPPELLQKMIQNYDESVAAMRVVFGRDPGFEEMLNDSRMAREFWHWPWGEKPTAGA